MPFLQLQSPFFRLPRELRDSTYEFYVIQEHGYRHDNGKLIGNDRQIEFDLSYSCKIIFDEMRGVHLKANEIIFAPVRPQADALSHSSDPEAKIKRFQTLQHAIFESKLAVLSCTASCVDSIVISRMRDKYPDDFLSDIAVGIAMGKLNTHFFWKDNDRERERALTDDYPSP